MAGPLSEDVHTPLQHSSYKQCLPIQLAGPLRNIDTKRYIHGSPVHPTMPAIYASNKQPRRIELISILAVSWMHRLRRVGVHHFFQQRIASWM